MSAEPTATLDPELVDDALELGTVHGYYVAGEFPEAAARRLGALLLLLVTYVRPSNHERSR